MKSWKRRFHLALASLMLGGAARAEPPPGYARMEHGGVIYHVLTVDPAQVQLRWKDADGTQLRAMARLKAEEEAAGRKVWAIMNGGIFEPGGIPSGLYVEKGVELRQLNLADAPGNFFLKPNGVFAVYADKAMIRESTSFELKRELGLNLRAAVQSGPLLLNHGDIHPKFSATSTNRLHRNGIGIQDVTGQVVLVMSAFKQE